MRPSFVPVVASGVRASGTREVSANLSGRAAFLPAKPRGPLTGDPKDVVGKAPLEPETYDETPSYTRYEPLFEIASGGMGTVYVGLRLGLAGFARVVAIKRIRANIAEDEEANAALNDEAAIASLVQHANVVAIHDVHERDGELLLVMDYVEGASLADLLRKLRAGAKRLSRGVALRIIYDALCGLHAAHELTDHHGKSLELVHRDATPQNILIGTDGCVRLTDFGIARAVERSVQTDPGLAKGKYAYMAPEHAFAEPLDRRADIFAMGVVLWETLTGRRLFQNRTIREVARGTALGQIPAPSHRGADSPAELDAIVLKAMAPWKDDRYSTAKEFADDIDAFASTVGGLPPATAIAEMLDLVCGEEIAVRAARLREVLKHRAPSLSSRSSIRRRVRPEEMDDAAADPAPEPRATLPTLVDPLVVPGPRPTPTPPEAGSTDVMSLADDGLDAAAIQPASPDDEAPTIVEPAEPIPPSVRPQQASHPRAAALRFSAFLFAAAVWALAAGIFVGRYTAPSAEVSTARRVGVVVLSIAADAQRELASEARR